MLEVRGISKSYGDRLALDGVSFGVAEGRMTGFVGGNGAGKTTAMRIILGVLAADAGEVLLDGAPLGAAARRRFGYMPEERGLYPKMPLREQLSYLARLHGFTARAGDASADALIDSLGLGERRNDPVEKLSLGNQQRAQIAAALVHRPTALVLDEPFSGLDPLAVDAVLGVLREYAGPEVPVLFSSHQLDIVERLCDDVVIIAGGRIREAGDADALRDRHAGIRYAIEGVSRAIVEAAPGIRIVDDADTRSADPRGDDARDAVLTVDADTEEAAQKLLRTASAAGPVRSFARVRPTLAQTYREAIR